MLREEVAQVVEIATAEAEAAKKDMLAVLTNELGQIKHRLAKLENKTTVKPADKPKKGE